MGKWTMLKTMDTRPSPKRETRRADTVSRERHEEESDRPVRGPDDKVDGEVEEKFADFVPKAPDQGKDPGRDETGKDEEDEIGDVENDPFREEKRAFGIPAGKDRLRGVLDVILGESDAKERQGDIGEEKGKGSGPLEFSVRQEGQGLVVEGRDIGAGQLVGETMEKRPADEDSQEHVENRGMEEIMDVETQELSHLNGPSFR